MIDLGAVRAALKTKVGTVVTPSELVDTPEVPCGIVIPDPPFDVRDTFDNNSSPRFVVLLLVAYVDTKGAQAKMDALLSSVPTAIESDQTLGGTATSVTVESLRSYSVITLLDGGTRYLSAELVVTVLG